MTRNNGSELVLGKKRERLLLQFLSCLKGFQNISTGEIERKVDINLKHRGEISAEGKLANL